MHLLTNLEKQELTNQSNSKILNAGITSDILQNILPNKLDTKLLKIEPLLYKLVLLEKVKKFPKVFKLRNLLTEN